MRTQALSPASRGVDRLANPSDTLHSIKGHMQIAVLRVIVCLSAVFAMAFYVLVIPAQVHDSPSGSPFKLGVAGVTVTPQMNPSAEDSFLPCQETHCDSSPLLGKRRDLSTNFKSTLAFELFSHEATIFASAIDKPPDSWAL
jgi:hypothetical protein